LVYVKHIILEVVIIQAVASYIVKISNFNLLFNRLVYMLVVAGMISLNSCNPSPHTHDTIPPVPDSVNYQTVLAALDEIVNTTGTADSYYQRARIRVKTRQFQAASEDIQKAIDKDNGQPKYYLLRAEIYYDNHQTEKAIADAEQAKTLQLQNPELFALLGKLYFLKNNYQASLQHLDKAIDLSPYYAEAWFWKGKNALAVFDTTKAISNFQTTLNHQKDFAEAYTQLAMIYNNLRNFGKARSYISSGLSQNPDYSGLHYQLAENCRLTIRNFSDVNRIDSANAHYLFAVRSDTSFFRAYYEIGLLSFLQKDYPKALLYFEKVKNKKQVLPANYTELLALSYDFTGQWENAVQAYANVVSEDIFNKNVKALERYEQIKGYLAAQKYRAYADSMARLYPNLYTPNPQHTEAITVEPLQPKEVKIK
jgi:tetratricopeptide (TPR) repeat protein